MAKNVGPCFEFCMDKRGAKVNFIFLQGNVSKRIYDELKDTLLTSFQKIFGKDSENYISKFELSDGTSALAIDQTRILQVLSWIVGRNASSVFKAKITGLTKETHEETILINNYLDVKKASKVIPCCYMKEAQINKNTTKR